MHLFMVLLIAAQATLGAAVVHRHHLGGNNSAKCLLADAIQTASTFTGQEAGTKGIYDGQAPSKA